MRFLTKFPNRTGVIAVIVSCVALISTVVYSQMQLNESIRATKFNTFAVLRNTYIYTKHEYWKQALINLPKLYVEQHYHNTIDSDFLKDQLNILENAETLVTGLLKDHLNAIELACRLFVEGRLDSYGIEFVNNTVKEDVKIFSSDELQRHLKIVGISDADIPTCK